MAFFKRWFASKEPPSSAQVLPGGQEDAALTLLTTVVASDPQNGEAYLGLGMLRLRQFAAEPAVSTLHDAVSNLTQAVALLPNSPEAHFYLAFAESFTLDTIDEAEQHLQRALQLDPSLVERAAEIQQRIGEARSGLQQQAVDPDTLRAAVQRYEDGQTLVDTGRSADAVDAFNDAIALYPAYAEALLALGDAYRQLGQDDVALTMYRRALAVRPRMFEAHVSLGSLYVARGDHARALDQLSLALEQAPDQPQVLRNVGLLQLATNQGSAAMQTFRRLCALQPEDPEPRLHLALAAAHDGDTTAVQDALQRIENAQLSAKQHRLAAQIYERLGDGEQAARQRAQADVVETDSPNRADASNA